MTMSSFIRNSSCGRLRGNTAVWRCHILRPPGRPCQQRVPCDYPRELALFDHFRKGCRTARRALPRRHKTVARASGNRLCLVPGRGTAIKMADEKEPITIKKYANRRLYNTGTSAYVTLE